VKGRPSKTKSRATIERDDQARVRRADRNNRSDEQQLALLEERGAGGCKEAMQIRNRLDGKAMEGLHPDEAPKPVKRNRPARKRRLVPASLM